MYYLAIDWGKTKCGIAVADKETLIANTYRQIQEADVYQEIFDFSKKEKVDKIIIGYHEDLTKDKRFNEFVEKIKQLEIPIEFENEEYSTQIAQKNLMTVRSRNISRGDDVESARVILQSWLDKIN